LPSRLLPPVRRAVRGALLALRGVARDPAPGVGAPRAVLLSRQALPTRQRAFDPEALSGRRTATVDRRGLSRSHPARRPPRRRRGHPAVLGADREAPRAGRALP